MRQKLACEGLVMQNISYYIKLNDIQEKNFIKMNSMKIMILLAWVANFMVIFSASYIYYYIILKILYIILRTLLERSNLKSA